MPTGRRSVRPQPARRASWPGECPVAAGTPRPASRGAGRRPRPRSRPSSSARTTSTSAGDPIGYRHAEPSDRRIDARVGAADRRDEAGGQGQVDSVAYHDVDPVAADHRTSARLGVPSATTRPASIIADPVGELIGLLQVLRGEQHRGPVRDQAADQVPHLVRLRGSRPVVGSSRKSTRGVRIRLAARSSRRRIPPEYSPAGPPPRRARSGPAVRRLVAGLRGRAGTAGRTAPGSAGR